VTGGILLASTWADAFSAAGALAAVAAAVGGAIVAIRYGRKATVEVTAEAVARGATVLLAVRPSVQASGVFRLRFPDGDGSRVRVTEVWTTEAGLADGRYWETSAVFGSSHVEAGEKIWTTVLFQVDPLDGRLMGWRVMLDVAVARRFSRGREWVWDDRIFLSAPVVA
jgi:hypothetical protein